MFILHQIYENWFKRFYNEKLKGPSLGQSITNQLEKRKLGITDSDNTTNIISKTAKNIISQNN